jgi:ATP-binding cassette, subfamily B, multidrug efflux pump
MTRLLKYLKPYRLLILAAIVLLFGQALCDLALPDYMSRIVNVGIQQGGVESPVPEAIRASEMDRLMRRVSPPDAARVLGGYELVEPSSAAAGRLAAKYPAALAQTVYARKSLGRAELSAIEPILTRAWLAGAAAGRPGAGLPAFSPSAARQAAARAVRAEYLALGAGPGRLQMAYMLATGAMMLLLAFLGAIATVLVGFLSAKVAAGLARDLRTAVFTRVESFSNREFDTFSTASLINRSTNDVMQIQMVVMMMIRMVIYAPIIGVGGIIKALGKDSSMWWVIALAVAILVVLVCAVFGSAAPKFKIMQKLTDRLNLVSREGLSGMMVIRAFNMQGSEEGRFDTANKELTRNMLFVNRVTAVMMPVMMLIMNGVSLLIVWVGARQVAQASLQVGDMMAFMQYAIQIVFAFLMMSFMFIMLPRAAVSADRVAEVLALEPSILDPAVPVRIGTEFDGTVDFRGVSFRYPGAEDDVLHQVSFTARPGETTAIIGATGSGKSTVVGLIPRFYDVTEGSVVVGGVDVREVAQGDLRDRIGYVPQKSVLFSGTIESNLRYADERAAPEALESAARIAQASGFIAASPEGMALPISQGGANVSGGQRQRLAIARALVKRPPICIFDDSFSALDFKTDSALRQSLKEETAGSTVIIVTQRIAPIKNADQIVVLDEGRVVGLGRHGELMENCETYREIATSQLSKEELQ